VADRDLTDRRQHEQTVNAMDLSGKSREELMHDLRAMTHAHDLYKAAHPAAEQTAQRRATDGAHEDHTGERTMSNGGNGFDIGYKGAGVHARGPLAILAIVFVLMTGVLGWISYSTGERIHSAIMQSNAGHTEMAASQDRMACIVSLSAEERARLRIQVSRETFVHFCPWLRLP
jgi:hypothetical protein